MTAGPLAEADVLAAWEHGIDAAPAVRGLALLMRAAPEDDGSALRKWPLGRQSLALLELHAASFGELVQAHTPCPACGEELELVFSAREMLRSAWPEPAPLRLNASGEAVELRLPTVDDAMAAASAATAPAARELLLERVVLRAEKDGQEIPARALPDEIVRRIGECLAAADPCAELTLTLTCPLCATDVRVPFDVCDFLWRELEARARELLEQVSALASAYGWPEREILALSPTRRRFYLELAGT